MKELEITAEEARTMAMEYSSIDRILPEIREAAKCGKLNKRFRCIVEKDVEKLRELGYKVKVDSNYEDGYEVSW